MTCPDCRASPTKLCATHAATDNLTEEMDADMLLREAVDGLWRYSAHLRGCPKTATGTYAWVGKTCTCGLDALTVRLRGAR